MEIRMIFPFMLSFSKSAVDISKLLSLSRHNTNSILIPWIKGCFHPTFPNNLPQYVQGGRCVLKVGDHSSNLFCQKTSSMSLLAWSGLEHLGGAVFMQHLSVTQHMVTISTREDSSSNYILCTAASFCWNSTSSSQSEKFRTQSTDQQDKFNYLQTKQITPSYVSG